VKLLPFLITIFFAVASSTFLQATPAEQEKLRRQITYLENRGDHAAAVPLYEQLRRLAPEDSSLVQDLARTLAVLDAHGRIVALLKPWLRDHPDDTEAYLRLGRAYLHLDQSQDALKTWRRALERAPTPRLYQQVSNYCRGAGLYEAAIQVLMDGRKALHQEQLFGWELAALYLLNEDYRRAIDAYLEHLRETPQRFAAVEHRLVSVAQDPARGPKLLQALEGALKEGDEPLQVSFLISICALESGVPQTGFEALAAIADQTEDIGPALFRFASRCQALGDDEIAIQAYALFAEHSQDSPQLYRALLQQAALHMRLHNYPRAVTLYSQLARQFPHRPEALEALFHLGKLQLEIQADIPAARTSLEAVLHSSPRGPWAAKALALLAECELRQDDLERAETHLRQLAHQDPSSTQLAHFRLAELAYFQGDQTAAARSLQTLLKNDPRHELANDALELTLLLEAPQARPEDLSALALAQLRERQGRPAAAAEQWTWLDAYAPPPLRQFSLLARARIHEERQELEAALDLYEDLVADYPKGLYAPEAQIGRARLYEQQGKIDRALKVYETALLGFPEDVRVPEMRLQIQRLRHLQEG
jgi:tetratricopeptide (TPR) repeat protein